jgi:cytochrome oxidase Cu insertion factor (SCO1/SenC/PrrC family)
MSRFRAILTLSVLAGLAGSAALAGCGGSAPVSSAGQAPASSAAAMANPNLDLGTSLGAEPAPDFRLVNQFGQPMSLSQFRGKVVLLGFEDSQCTTVCPLTTQAMVEAKQLLGPAGDQVQLLGVDANPGATSVADVLSYSRTHGMVNKWNFLTGSLAQLKATWRAYHIAVQIEQGQIDHTPALFVIDSKGREQKLYLTQMAYSSVVQSAQVLAGEISSLLPSHPRVASQQSLATIVGQGPADHLTLPSAQAPGTVTLGPGRPRLVMFFATWLSEIGNLKSELLDANAYAAAARQSGLPQLVAVDETAVEPSAQAVRGYLSSLGASLNYPVALDTTGRVADGYGVQDQPWFTLVSASGKVLWKHDGWLPPKPLASAVKHALTANA